jgi:uncharacterized protein (DUF2267 family)
MEKSTITSGRKQVPLLKKEGQRRRYRTLNFEKYAHEGNRFINEVAYLLDSDRGTAGRITRAVLQAVRDRLPPDDAIQFAQGLPMAIKGLFIDQYDISKTPVPIRNSNDFIEFVRSRDRFAANVDFPTPYDVVFSLKAVFRVLEMTMDRGQVMQIKKLLPGDIARLTDDYSF